MAAATTTNQPTEPPYLGAHVSAAAESAFLDDAPLAVKERLCDAVTHLGQADDGGRQAHHHGKQGDNRKHGVGWFVFLSPVKNRKV